MQLPDESIAYHYQSLLSHPGEEWTPGAEFRSKNFLNPAKLRALVTQLNQVKGQVAAERELKDVPAEMQPLDAGFLDLPQQTLDAHRRKGEASDLGRVLEMASRLKAMVDRVVILGIGGSYLGARALFEALCNSYHNEMLPQNRPGVPRIYFEGNSCDNDGLQDLLELLQNTCVDPELREERWGVVVVSKSGGTLETAAAYRVFRREAVEFYGSRSERLQQLIIPVTGKEGKLRDLVTADGYAEEEIMTIPDNVGGRYSVFTAAGLLPAAVMGLDVRALLLGAASMTRRFLEEPFERNPVLQFAAINHLMTEDVGKSIRVMAVWSKKLEALGMWYDQLLSESLGKHGRGATPMTVVNTRDLHSRGQQHQEGARDKVINNLIIKTPRTPPIMIGMVPDRNEDDLNSLSRKGLPDLSDAAYRGTEKAYFDAARPTATIELPSMSEHVMGQLMQMLMLATVIEGRLMGINPYGQPGVEAYKKNMRALLKS
jgi:glucose-6-phosphate isomerase